MTSAHAPLPTRALHARARASAPALLRRAAARAFAIKPQKLDRLTASFPVRDDLDRERIRTVARSFVCGYNTFAAAAEPADVRASLAEIPRFYRPFGWEGAAMGFGPWALLAGAGYDDFEPLLHELTPKTVYQSYVGLGWWLGMWYGGRADALAAISARFDRRYRLLVYEGVGFRAGFLARGDGGATARFARHAEAARHVCHQGYGRSLWFVHMDDWRGAEEAIARVGGSYRGDCYSGLGLGCAYSWIDRPELVSRVAATIPPRFRDDFSQGAAFGWEARQLADRRLFDRMLRRLADRAPVDGALDAVHDARRALEAVSDELPFYERWRKTTRENLADGGLIQAIAELEVRSE